jgi:hypothetical protein
MREIPVDDWIEIGALSRRPRETGRGGSHAATRPHEYWYRTDTLHNYFHNDALAAYAGIDPLLLIVLLMGRVAHDNLRAVPPPHCATPRIVLERGYCRQMAPVSEDACSVRFLPSAFAW